MEEKKRVAEIDVFGSRTAYPGQRPNEDRQNREMDDARSDHCQYGVIPPQKMLGFTMHS
jgi:hypothetical protein